MSDCCKPEGCKKNRPMGIGKLATVTLAKQNRWTLSADSLEEAFVQGPVEIDYLKKELKFNVIEAASGDEPINAHQFAQAIMKWPASEGLTLHVYDGCGGKLYERNFEGLKTISMTQVFDYASSEVSAIHFVLSYSSTYSRRPKSEEDKEVETTPEATA